MNILNSLLMILSLKYVSLLVIQNETGCSSHLIFKNFDYFKEIDFSCINQKTLIVTFIPNKRLILNSHLVTNDKKTNLETNAIFIHLKGFDIQTSGNLFNYLNSKKYNLIIQRSIFEFYFNDSKVTNSDCDSEKLYSSFQYFFKDYIIKMTLDENKYSNEICPFIFRDASIKELVFTSFVNTFVKRNYIKFANNSKKYCNNINCKIEKVQIKYAYKITLSELIINDCVFKKVVYFNAYGLITHIEKNTFIYFESLKQIKFYLTNLKEFIHNGFEWVKFINYNKKQTITSLKTEIYLLEDDSIAAVYEYKYPNEDYCDFFKDVLNEKSISVKLGFYISNPKVNLTCTMLYILQQDKKLFSERLNKTENTEYLASLYTFIQNCNLLINCSQESNQSNIRTNSENTENCMESNECFVYSTETVEFFIEIIFHPFLCAIGILLNGIIVFVINSKKNKEAFFKKHTFYIYIVFNSSINVLIFLFDFFVLINLCIESNGIYCSSIRENKLSQAYFIFYNFIQEFLIFISNSTLFLFSLNRFLVINIVQSNRFLKISEKKIFKYMILISFLINVVKLFEYQINDDIRIYDEYPVHKRKVKSNFDSMKFYSIYFILIDLLNNLLSYVAILIIDILLVIRVSQVIKKKVENNFATKESNNKNKATKLVIAFCLSNIAFKTPYFVVSIIMMKFNGNLFLFNLTNIINRDVICYSEEICEKFFKISFVIFKISFINNFFLLYFFNSLFRKKAKEFF